MIILSSIQSTLTINFINRCGTPGFVAPEVLAGLGDDVKYGLECDIFSTGVIYYILLTGEPLFDSSERKVLLELNKKCEIDFN
jgi:serine/threonine protein kinase